MDSLSGRNAILLLVAVLVVVVWVVGTVVYRLFFHPLSGIPGPRLAAVTYLYEFYYDIYLSGQYNFKLKQLHEQYGPVVRLNPDEVHFNDPDYYDEIFNLTRTDKPYREANAFGPYPATVSTVHHDIHRIRRGALNPFFSKRSVASLTPFIQDIIDKLCGRFETISKTGEKIDLKAAFSALSMDIMSEYCFSKTPDRVLMSDFDKPYFASIDEFLDYSLVNWHLPWIMNSMLLIPESILCKIFPVMVLILDQRRAAKEQILAIRSGENRAYEKSGHSTIFHTLLESDLPPQEKDVDRLTHEAWSLLSAGSHTTALFLKTAAYHIQANQHVRTKLLEELRTVMPNRNDRPELADLERLPYLTAVVQEGLRMSNVVSHRLSRSFPNKTVTYGNHVVPAGTAIYLSSPLIHENEDIFPEPHVFKPERWLGGSKDDQQRLLKYLTPFSKGTRACLGINLAWAECYLILGTVFRRFEFDLSDVVRERDVDITEDMILAVVSRKSKGTIVKVSKMED
ncbi:MAG: hypothetical protein M1820_000946 [Bogoriella megaspora]|nr:MAG: hypothetical protein M1820_000946 [Bogoriella megaspora]